MPAVATVEDRAAVSAFLSEVGWNVPEGATIPAPGAAAGGAGAGDSVAGAGGEGASFVMDSFCA